jgi:hypothetical protein
VLIERDYPVGTQLLCWVADDGDYPPAVSIHIDEGGSFDAVLTLPLDRKGAHAAGVRTDCKFLMPRDYKHQAAFQSTQPPTEPKADHVFDAENQMLQQTPLPFGRSVTRHS